MSGFWKPELCSLCFTSTQKCITLVFLFPINGNGVTYRLDSSHLSCLCSFNKRESSICKWWLDSLLSFKASGSEYLARQQLVFQTREDQSLNTAQNQYFWYLAVCILKAFGQGRGKFNLKFLSLQVMLFTRFIPSSPIKAVVLDHKNNIKDDREDT